MLGVEHSFKEPKLFFFFLQCPIDTVRFNQMLGLFTTRATFDNDIQYNKTRLASMQTAIVDWSQITTLDYSLSSLVFGVLVQSKLLRPIVSKHNV